MRAALGLLALLAVAPLLVPAAVLCLRVASDLVRGNALPNGGEMWLLLFGPAVPIYLLVLPLAPFLLIAQRRGWKARPWIVVVSVVAIGALFDIAFRFRFS